MKFLNILYRQLYPAKTPDEIRRDYGIPDKIDFKIEFCMDGWMILTSEQLPGLITEGRDPKNLLEMFNDAVLTYYDVPKKDADIVFPKILLSGIGTVSYKNSEIHCNA
jgi:hypothetical protein